MADARSADFYSLNIWVGIFLLPDTWIAPWLSFVSYPYDAIYTADKSPGQREARHTAVFFAAGAALTKWSESQVLFRWAVAGKFFDDPLRVGILLALFEFALVEWGGSVPKLKFNYGWPLILVGLSLSAARIIKPKPRLEIRVFALLPIVVVADAAQRMMGRPAVNARLYQLQYRGRLSRPVLSNY